MPRYATRSWTVYENDEFSEGECGGFDVEITNEDRPTGLLDSRGDMIWRLKEPVGFVDFET